ncbi:type II secretion system protein N [Limnohabitans sp.]|uniref:type II secretion system protein N n=1 Tax=Limnohabitans sp. TaxID=1907725 RepID=UPI0037C04351
MNSNATLKTSHWPSGLAACAWALAAASAVYWGLQWATPQTAQSATNLSTAPESRPGAAPAMARALGQIAAQEGPKAQTNSQFKLLGVIASSSGQGSALIATDDGQPPKAYRVGQAVQDGLTLVSLTPRQARLQSSSAEVLLELPDPDKP